MFGYNHFLSINELQKHWIIIYFLLSNNIEQNQVQMLYIKNVGEAHIPP